MKKNNKKLSVIVFLSLFLFSSLFPFLRPAIEGLTFPNDIAGLNLSSNADFYAISESDHTTRWILQNSTLSPVANFTDDISGANWYLTDMLTRTMDISINPAKMLMWMLVCLI